MRPRPRRIDPNTIVLLKHIGAGFLVFTAVALIIVGVWYGTRIPSLTITKVEARGGETVEPATVERLAETILDGEYLGLVPRRFAWFYPEEELRHSVSSLERIYNVQVQQDGGTELRITYDEYVPQALWCRSVADEYCLFVDTGGHAFGHAPKLTGGSFLRLVTTGRDPTVGETVAPPDIYGALNELVRLLAGMNWYVSSLEIDQAGDAYLGLSGGGELKIAVGVSPAETVANLSVILASDEFKHLTPGNFQYIDLRFGERVFVNEEMVTLPTAPHGTSTSSSTPNESGIEPGEAEEAAQ